VLKQTKVRRKLLQIEAQEGGNLLSMGRPTGSPDLSSGKRLPDVESLVRRVATFPIQD